MKHKKLVTFIFSFIILVGLCIGVFADNTYNDDRLGFVYGSKPYDAGTVIVNNGGTISSGYYIFHFISGDYVQPADAALVFVDTSNSTWYLSTSHSLRYNSSNLNDVAIINPGEYCYVYFQYETNISVNPTYGYQFEIYTIKESSIDIYNNSQDVWSSLVSTVTTGTNTIIDNDILLLFAAALPIVSFGAGMLIRLLRKS